MKTKVCTKCGVEKEAITEFFAKYKRGRDGLGAYCKSCQALYYQENKEYILERAKQHHKNNKEQKQQYYHKNKEIIVERKKQYRQANKEYIAEYYKQYRRDNKEYIAECKRKHGQENPEKYAIKSQRRRARERKLDCTLTPEQWENIKEDFNHKCAYCGKEDKLVQEHFLPLSKGGEYTHNNIVPACRSCNSSKGAKMFSEWYPSYEHYSKKREKYLLQYLGYKGKQQQLSIL